MVSIRRTFKGFAGVVELIANRMLTVRATDSETDCIWRIAMH